MLNPSNLTMVDASFKDWILAQNRATKDINTLNLFLGFYKCLKNEKISNDLKLMLNSYKLLDHYDESTKELINNTDFNVSNNNFIKDIASKTYEIIKKLLKAILDFIKKIYGYLESLIKGSDKKEKELDKKVDDVVNELEKEVDDNIKETEYEDKENIIVEDDNDMILKSKEIRLIYKFLDTSLVNIDIESFIELKIPNYEDNIPHKLISNVLVDYFENKKYNSVKEAEDEITKLLKQSVIYLQRFFNMYGIDYTLDQNVDLQFRIKYTPDKFFKKLPMTLEEFLNTDYMKIMLEEADLNRILELAKNAPGELSKKLKLINTKLNKNISTFYKEYYKTNITLSKKELRQLEVTFEKLLKNNSLDNEEIELMQWGLSIINKIMNDFNGLIFQFKNFESELNSCKEIFLDNLKKIIKK